MIRPAPQRAEAAAYAIKSFLAQPVRLIFGLRSNALKYAICPSP
mgnify:CR=1 FL=1